MPRSTSKLRLQDRFRLGSRCRAAIALTLTTLLVLSATTLVTSQPAEARVPIPQPIVRWFTERLGMRGARGLLEGQGFMCSDLAGVVCWQEGSYEPARRAAGTVDTGVGAAGYIHARGCGLYHM